MDAFQKSLKITYDEENHLKKITVCVEDKEKLLYIYYKNAAEAETALCQFAQKNAETIIQKINPSTEPIVRLFVDYFYDGLNADLHAQIGTETEKEIL